MAVFVWDEPKRLANLKRHGLDFAEAETEFDWDTAVTVPTYAGLRGEERFKAMGTFKGRLIVVVFAPLGTEAIAIISMRTADAKERRLYGEAQE